MNSNKCQKVKRCDCSTFRILVDFETNTTPIKLIELRELFLLELLCEIVHFLLFEFLNHRN